MSINKTRIANKIADQSGLSKNRSAKALAAVLDLISQSLASGDEVKIAGFGKFYPQTLMARKCNHPKTGKSLKIKSRRTVRFKCYKRLRDRINPIKEPGDRLPVDAVPDIERRGESRMDNLPKGKAVIRISGIPVCEFEVKDVSGNGTSILVPQDSVILRNLRLGQDIELHMVYEERRRKAVLQRSKIAHITHQSDGDAYPGHVMVGMETIDTLPIS